MRAPDHLLVTPAGAERPPAGAPVSLATKAKAVGLVLAVMVVVMLIGRSRTELIAPIGPDVETLAIFVGTFAGMLLVGAALLRWAQGTAPAPSPKVLVNLLAATIMCVVAASWSARTLVEWHAFAGLSPASFPARFTVVGERYSKGAHYLRVRFGAAGREFSVRVGGDVYDAAHPGETLTLPVQTGRGGVQRMILPDRPIATGDLHPG